MEPLKQKDIDPELDAELDNRAWKILLVEDDEDDYILTRALLSEAKGKQFELHWASTFDQAGKMLQEQPWDAALVDYDLGAQTGVDFVRLAASLPEPVPAILLTGRGSYDIDLEAMHAGAYDYLVKGEINAPLLERSIRYTIERQQSQQALRRANDELERRVELRTSQLQVAYEHLVSANQDLQEEIAQRRRAEEGLLEREARLRLFLEELPAIVWSTDPDMNFTSIRGRGLAEAEGEAPAGAVVEELFSQATVASPAALAAHKRALQGRSGAYELDWLDRSYRCYVEPFHNSEERLIGCIGIALDQSESLRMQAELAEVQRRLIDSTESERLQLAQELHDGPMQELYGLTYHLETLRNGGDDQERSQTISALQARLQGVIHTLRATAGELRPPTLAPLGLEKAIRSHADHFQQTEPDLVIRLNLAPDGQALSERVRLALFRIYQMALTNVIRHAEATEVDIRLSLNPETVTLEIQDDGRGFQLPERWVELARQGHLGLVGALERAEAVGGKLYIETAPGRGTLVRVIVQREEPNGSPQAAISPQSTLPLGESG